MHSSLRALSLNENFGPFFLSSLAHGVILLYLGYQTSVHALKLAGQSSPMVFEIQADAYAANLQPQTVQKESLARAKAPVKAVVVPPVQDKGALQEKAPVAAAANQQASLDAGTQASSQTATGISGGKSGTSYVDGLRSWIERHKTYPRQAQRLGISGQVVVMLEVDHRGFFQNLTLSESSTHAILDEAALSLLRGIGSYRPFPDYLKQSKIRVRLPIQYVLN